jgi:isocitrate dehydrogenase kinase/phosphatase
MFEKLVPYDAAYLILEDYMHYYYSFKRITKRAKLRFEERDWPGIQADSRRRITLYRDSVGNTTEKLLLFLGQRAANREMWQRVKRMYLDEITNFNSRNVAETWYNSIFRHSHQGLSADEELMFVHATGTYREFHSLRPIFHRFKVQEPLEDLIRLLMSHYPFDAEFEDLDRDIRHVAYTLSDYLNTIRYPVHEAHIEMLRSVFYRNKGAYLVGRLVINGQTTPFVLPLLNEKGGIFMDACLMEYNDVSSIFSYNRSYFLVDTEIPSEMVDFLRTLLPTKSLSELYNSIGFEKHGKTVLYRDFLRHLAKSDDKFVVAPGIRGMVMAVFTLPSYPMVFKVIKDTFAAPKNVTEQEVKKKYHMVSLHDRVGRMSDSHMFEYLTLPLERFEPALLAELQEEAPSKIRIVDGEVEIRHLYIEKKMYPLNLYLDEVSPQEAREAIKEYGKAIKQMAAVNIFPGDMLLKNFGVTRLNRVVFYDYDEIGFLTDYNFRYIPEARTEEEEMSGEPWYSVGPMDVFPEEFPRFLIGRADIRKMFYELHGDLYDVKFWVDVQKRLRKGEIMDVFPYRQRLRFKKRFAH